MFFYPHVHDAFDNLIPTDIIGRTAISLAFVLCSTTWLPASIDVASRASFYKVTLVNGTTKKGKTETILIIYQSFFLIWAFPSLFLGLFFTFELQLITQ